MTRRCSAPGKLVLIGEYAVTDGFPAVVAAVNRRARVIIEPASDLRVRGNDPRWLSVPPIIGDDDGAAHEQPLLLAVMRELQGRGRQLGCAHIEVSTAAFSAEGKKMGLGSSAAAAVAFAFAFGGDDDVDPAWIDIVYDVAFTAHRAFQGGGSGIDIAASTYGGVLCFRQGRAAPAPPLPNGLAVVVAWTGVPAKTQGFINAYRALPGRQDHALAIDAATTRFLGGCSSGDPSEVMRAIADARRAMEQMGQAARIDVVTAEHRSIAQLAIAAGGEAKPSGAGGGDIAVCFVPVAAQAQLAEALTAAGFPIVDVTVGEPGVRFDP